MSFSLALYFEPKAHQPARLAGEEAPSLLLRPLLRRARITNSHQPPQPLLWGPGICTQVCMPVQQALYTLPPEPSPQPTNVNCSGTSLAGQRLQPDSEVRDRVFLSLCSHNPPCLCFLSEEQNTKPYRILTPQPGAVA